jgi:type IV secretion system protein VirB11
MQPSDILLSLAGTLRNALEDPTVIEIMCNPNGRCFITRHGQGTSEASHPGFGTLDRFLGAVAHEVGAEFRATRPGLAAALDTRGWRIQAGRPPLASQVYCAIRKHPPTAWSLAEYVAADILTPGQAHILREALQRKARILFAGGVGSAKTSLLNAALLTLVDQNVRVIVCEDAPEIHCTQPNAVCTRTTPGQDLRQLIRDALRLNPDWLVVGEVRGGDALDMLKGFQTGHGGLATVHVDTAAHAFLRLEQLVQEVSLSPQRELIGQNVDLVCHMERTAVSWRCTDLVRCDGYVDGAYQLTSLAERSLDGYPQPATGPTPA